VEISLSEWVKTLPQASIKIAKNTLISEFKHLLFDTQQNDYDEIYDEIKKHVLDELLDNKYEWESRAFNSLKILQTNVIENDSISKSADWNAAVKVVDKLFRDKLELINKEI